MDGKLLGTSGTPFSHISICWPLLLFSVAGQSRQASAGHHPPNPSPAVRYIPSSHRSGVPSQLAGSLDRSTVL